MSTAETRAQSLLTEIDSLSRRYGDDPSTWPAGIRERSERLAVASERAVAELEALPMRESNAEYFARMRASGGLQFESGFGGAPGEGESSRSTDAWNGLDRAGSLRDLDTDAGLRARAQTAVEHGISANLNDATRERLTEMLDADKTSDASRFVLATGNPAYRSAFQTWLRDPATAPMNLTAQEQHAWREVTASRAAMGESGSSALLPLMLDPSIVLTNTGSAGGIRQYAKQVMTLSNQWRGVSSAGVTAQIKAEGVEATDASPTVGAIDISVYQGLASITLSWELLDDTIILSEIGRLIADAKVRQEDAFSATGTGSGEPYGFVTRLNATTASRVSPTTASTFTTASVADVFKVRDALPARHRNSGSTFWAANISAFSIIQQMSPAAQGSSFWADLGSGLPPRLLGLPVLEFTSMASTTTASSLVLGLVNGASYTMVDRLGVVIDTTNVLGSNGRSTGQREVVARWRVGADLDNADAGRILKL
ncbi:MAG: phage major capsid protein [Actinobacteria bacterium]|nr:phage major capsid protein [Actinomycetota bacterium]